MNLGELHKISDRIEDGISSKQADELANKKQSLAIEIESLVSKWLEEDSGADWSKSLYFKFQGKVFSVTLKNKLVYKAEIHISNGDTSINKVFSYEGDNSVAYLIKDYIELAINKILE